MTNNEMTSRERFLTAPQRVPATPPEPAPIVSESTESALNERIERYSGRQS